MSLGWDEGAPDRVWSYRLGHNITADPASARGLVYLAGRDGFLHALGLDDGQVRWRASLGAGTSSAPWPSGSIVVVGSEDRSLRGFDAISGRILWSTDLGHMIASSPTVAGELVVCGSGGARPGVAGGGLDAVDLTTGARRWHIDVVSGVRGAPCIIGNQVLAISRSGDAFSVELTTGEVHWNVALGGDATSTPASDGRLAVFATSTSVRALNVVDGQELWFAETGRALLASAHVSSAGVFVGGSDGHLYAFDPSTGETRWVVARRGRREWQVWGSPIVVDNRVVVGCSDERLYGVDASTGAVAWQVNVGATIYGRPAWTGDGVVVAAAHEGVAHRLRWSA